MTKLTPLVLIAALACNTEEPSGSASSTDDATSGATTTPDNTTGDPDTQGPGPSTSSPTTTDPDVTGDPSGPDDTTAEADSTDGPIDPPTEPEIVYERPAGAFFENITRTADGTLLFTDHTNHQIVSLTPQGEESVLAEIDDWPMSIVVDTDGTIVIAALHENLMETPVPFVTTNVVLIADGNGGADVLTEVPEANFLNGTCLLEAGVVLAADSSAATIWRIDVATGDVAPWLEDPLLSPENGSTLPAANGCKVNGDALFVSNSDRGTILRIPIDGGAAGSPSVYFNGPLVDDFAFAASGNIYATTHGAEVFRILPDLTMETIAGMPEGVVGNTAVVFGGTAFDDETIYIATDGGLYVADGNASQSGPARIVRVPVGESE